MRARDWYVEEYVSSEKQQAVYRQHFDDCASMIAHIKIRTLTLRGAARLRVHIPESATIAERQSIRNAGGAVF